MTTDTFICAECGGEFEGARLVDEVERLQAGLKEEREKIPDWPASML